MGNVSECFGSVTVDQNECIELLSCDLNKSSVITLSAVPVTYGIYINDDLIYSCNFMKNAKAIYNVIRADMAGKEWEG